MRTETLFGKTVNTVGNISADLVLESLGKIYIKSRNKALTLDEIISSICSSSEDSLGKKTIIIDSLSDLDLIEVKDGAFIYDKSSNVLYIKVNGEVIELINVNTKDTLYVKRTGDTMTGALTIKVPSGKAPLNVTSSILNKHFNAEYLNGLSSSAYAQKSKNENISGKWTHNNETNFNAPVYYRDTTMHYKDSLHTGSLGTPDFSSGFAGYGWRLDGPTNTLTIDYLIVRKAMYVYELVVNKIRATNGSLWVTNASKVEYVCQLPILITNNVWLDLNPNSSNPDKDIRGVIHSAKNNDGFIITSHLSTSTISADANADNTGYGTQKSIYDFRNLEVIMCKDETKLSSIIARYNNEGQVLDFSDTNLNDEEVNIAYNKYKIFDKYFDFDVVFPIAVPNLNINWYTDSAGNDNAYTIKYIKTYYKYFGQTSTSLNSGVLLSNLYLVKFDTDNLPVFMPGDLLRCQKFTGNGIKYYDAVVCNKLIDSYFIILVAENMMDKTTTISYDSNLNPTKTIAEDSVNRDFYDTTGCRSNNIIGTILEGDDIVLIGHLWDVTRQNAVYITSSDDGAPFMDTMSNVNRPDYSVIYNVPVFETIKLYKKGVLPFTGNYYVQSKSSGFNTVQYVLLQFTDENDITHNWTFLLNKIPTQVIAWYKSENNILTVPFDDIYSSNYTNLQRTEILDNIIRLEEILTGEDLPTFTSYSDIKLYVLLLVIELGITWSNWFLDVNTCEMELLRGYPNEYTNTIQSHEENPIITENDLELTDEAGQVFILEESVDRDTILPTRTTKARFGNLDGIVDSRFSVDKQPHGYGLYGENVFLTGEFILSNGKNVAQFDLDILALSSGLAMNSIEFSNLRKNIRSLMEAVPTYGDLQSAGIFLADNKMVLLGDSILVITTLGELGGYDAPTALFANGKIDGKFISVYDIHSAWHSDTTPSKVTQVLVTPENSISYYMELEVYTLQENGLTIMEDENHVLYFYLKEIILNGETVYVDEPVPYAKVYDAYKDFGWHLKALGNGYLALGNISWDSKGDLKLQGNIYLNYILESINQAGKYNGLYVVNQQNLENRISFLINGEFVTHVNDINSSTGLNVLYINAHNVTLYPILDVTINNTSLSLKKLAEFNCETLLSNNNMSIRLWIDNLTSLIQYTRGWTLQLVLLFKNAQDLYLDNFNVISEGTNSITINSDTSKIYICTYAYDKLVDVNGGLTYSTDLQISLIGSNFIKYYAGNKSLLWFGLDRFNITGISDSSNDVIGLEIDPLDNDIYIHLLEIDGPITSIVGNTHGYYYSSSRRSLTNLLDGDGKQINLFGNETIILDKNCSKNIVISSSNDSNKLIILTPGRQVNKQYPIIIGTIFTFSLDIKSHKCELEFQDGPVINSNANDTDDVTTTISLDNTPLTIMYLGNKNIGGLSHPVFRKLNG